MLCEEYAMVHATKKKENGEIAVPKRRDLETTKIYLGGRLMLCSNGTVKANQNLP